MSSALLKRRGAAAVETAIMMVFLVPTIMYVLFLQDAQWYKLEQEETVVSTPWDYSFVDWNQFNMQAAGAAPPAPADSDNDEESDNTPAPGYDPEQSNEQAPAMQPEAVDGVVARNARRTYCDHTSAYDSPSGNVSLDCADNHHTNFAAHQCWLTGKDKGTEQKGRQVSCTRTKDSYMTSGGGGLGGMSGGGLGSLMGNGISTFNDSFNQGGLIACDARLGVTNYFVINKFFEFWSKKDVTSLNRFQDRAGQHHGDAQSSEDGWAIVFIPQTAALMHDTWALNRPADIEPTDESATNRFHSRMKSYYDSGAMNLMQASMLVQKLSQDKLIGMQAAAVDGTLGDNLMTPPLAWKSSYDRKFDDFGTSGWTDDRQSDAHSNRQNYYLGDQNTK